MRNRFMTKDKRQKTKDANGQTVYMSSVLCRMSVQLKGAL